MELDYGFPGDTIWSGLDGNFRLRTVGTYIDVNNSFSTTGVRTNSAGTTGAPHWKVVINTSYVTDKFTYELDGRYVSANKVSNNDIQALNGVNSILDNRVGQRFYFNTSILYNVMEHWQLFAKVDNLLNTFPPVDANGLIEPQGRTGAGAQIYDIIGRQYAVGVRFNF